MILLKPNKTVLPLSLIMGIAALTIWLTYYTFKFGLNSPPATSGDEVDYDSLGWEMAHGRGFQVNTGDAGFRAPYDLAARQSSMYELGPVRQGTIAYRPPLFPLVLAGLDSIFGRQFRAARVFNAGCMAIICGIAVSFLYRTHGLPTALIGGLLMIAVDTRTRLYGRTLLTEPSAALCVTALCLVLSRLYRKSSVRDFLLAGVLLGVAILLRSSIFLWVPWVFLLMAWLAWQKESQTSPRPTSRQFSIRLGGFVAVLAVVLAPWMIRNCVVLQTFMPLGTQGTAQLPAGFSDVAWEHHGIWQNLAQRGFYDLVLTPGMTLLEEERAMARFGKEQALAWIYQHPVKAALLAPMKIWRELFPGDTIQYCLIMLALIGMIDNWRIPEIRMGMILFLINCIGIGMTWAVDGGRLIVPLIFVEDSLAAMGIVEVCRMFRKQPTGHHKSVAA